MSSGSTAPTVALEALAAGALAWRRTTHAQLAELMQACRRRVAAVADAWVETSLTTKGWREQPHSRAEEWASGPLPVARFLHLLHQLHAGLADGRLPTLHESAPRGADTTFAGLPARGLGDALLLRGCRAQLHCDGLVAPHEPARRGDVALVLGAGNVTATPVLDTLHQVGLEGRAVLLKLSPQHTDLAETFRSALAPLVEARLLHVVSGDAALGAQLASLPGLAAVHVTGSTATWAQLRVDPAVQKKQLSAEVGCCTPVFVVPGPWRDPELQHVACQLAAFVANNGGATCVAPRVVLTANGWPQRTAFLQHLRHELAALPARVPFHAAARTHFATAAGGPGGAEALRPTLRADLDAERDLALVAQEHFAPVLLELPLPGDSLASWFDRAAAFVRDHVFGALSCYVVAPPSLLVATHQQLAAVWATLPHGTIAVNVWPGLGYGLGTTPWGVPAGSAWQHGQGWTRGTACLPAVRRVVLDAPFRPRPRPPWLPGRRGAAATLRALTHHYLAPAPHRLLTTALHAIRR